MRAFLQVAALAIIIRAILIIYGEWQDHFLEVKYTDADYWVFNDAAENMIAGRSPFMRKTYRYTPLVAILLFPNIYLTPLWGKALFCACDLLAGWLIYLLLRYKTGTARAAKLSAVLWLLNPMIVTISTRGNAESILSCLVLGTIYAITSGQLIWGAILFGLAVHFKLFPAIYGIAILTFLWTRSASQEPGNSTTDPDHITDVQSSTSTGPPRQSTNIASILKSRKIKKNNPPPSPPTILKEGDLEEPIKTSINDRLWTIFVFLIISVGVFVLLTAIFLWKYCSEYWEEGLVYHLLRKDHRHNFSPYFYLFYTESLLPLPKFLAIGRFLPQLILLLGASLKLGRHDLPFACFIITFIFVTFNKYFVWYLTLFPMAYVSLHNLTIQRWTLISALWFGAQALWLHFAYQLEFLGQEVFFRVWAASMVFMMVNTWIGGQFIRHAEMPEIVHLGPGIITLNKTSL